MLILVIALFLVCWGPKLILLILIEAATVLSSTTFFSQEWYFVRVVFNLIPFVHSCINPGEGHTISLTKILYKHLDILA
jgi:hypothetical protein